MQTRPPRAINVQFVCALFQINGVSTYKERNSALYVEDGASWEAITTCFFILSFRAVHIALGDWSFMYVHIRVHERVLGVMRDDIVK